MDHMEMLQAIVTNPAVLPAAPERVSSDAVKQRPHGQRCFRCGAPAAASQVAATGEGPRWIDLCQPHQDEYEGFQLMLEAQMDNYEYGVGPVGAAEPTHLAGVHQPGLANAHRLIASEHPDYQVYRKLEGGEWVVHAEKR